MIPRGALPPKEAAVLFALLRIEVSGETPTVRALGAAAGISPAPVVKHLRALRSEGLVDYVDHGKNTLHSTLVVLPIGVR